MRRAGVWLLAAGCFESPYVPRPVHPYGFVAPPAPDHTGAPGHTGGSTGLSHTGDPAHSGATGHTGGPPPTHTGAPPLVTTEYRPPFYSPPCADGDPANLLTTRFENVALNYGYELWRRDAACQSTFEASLPAATDTTVSLRAGGSYEVLDPGGYTVLWLVRGEEPSVVVEVP